MLFRSSFEAVTLKKVPKKPSPQEETTAPVEPEKTGKAKIPMMKELSPQAVQLRKISTQLEEEVDEEEPEVEEEEEDEAWGWELVPSESYGSEDWEGEEYEEGAVETPGMTRRGERMAAEIDH